MTSLHACHSGGPQGVCTVCTVSRAPTARRAPKLYRPWAPASQRARAETKTSAKDHPLHRLQAAVGTVIKCGEDDDPIGVCTVLSLRQHSQLKSLAEFKSFLLAHCPDKGGKQALEKVSKGCTRLDCGAGVTAEGLDLGGLLCNLAMACHATPVFAPGLHYSREGVSAWPAGPLPACSEWNPAGGLCKAETANSPGTPFLALVHS